MAIHIDSAEELLSRLKEQYSAQEARLIGIDGVMGSGKTPLARELSARLVGRHIQCDDYHPGNGTPYVTRLDADRLRADISTAVAHGPTFLDGICLLNVLDRLTITIDCLVYVFPQSPTALENDWFDDDIPLDGILASLNALGTDTDRLEREIAIYTKGRRPHERAAYTFRWPAKATDCQPH